MPTAKLNITASRDWPQPPPEENVTLTMPLSTARKLRALCVLNVVIPNAIAAHRACTPHYPGNVITRQEASDLLTDIHAALGEIGVPVR